jgi:hypothetical protein
MSCKLCSSQNQSSFPAEINIHIHHSVTTTTLLFPVLLVCLDCGFTEFSIEQTELQRLANSKSTKA